jgi:polysaccharide deacetylase family protein (PEP-CTERM system associated)
MKNALTIDLEDYYHVTAFRDQTATTSWNHQQSRVERSTELLLSLLQETDCKATFFVLGHVAERHPQLVRRVAEGGHEVACHSLRHRSVYEMTPIEFREDTRRAKELLEDIVGSPIRGYRAPSFSINRQSFWAFEVLVELGFTFDSSIFPVKHPNYGVPDSPREPYRVETPGGSIVEFPMTTLQLIGRRAPLGGGAYFRFLPYWYTRWGMRFLNKHENRPVCVYLHPWELDPDQPKMSGSLTSQLRHYFGLRNTATKFRKLLRDFQFSTLGAFAETV